MKVMTNKQRCKNCLHRCVCLYQSYFDGLDYLGERCKHYKPKKKANRLLVELTTEEVEMVRQGISDHISDYCFSASEEKHYEKLLAKFDKIKTTEKEAIR